MDVAVSTKLIMDTNGKRRTNKRWPDALKREIVAATFAPGASVSIVARQYDVNANQVFGWRRRFGPAIQAPSLPVAQRPRLMEVTLAPELAARPPPTTPTSSPRNGDDDIEIEVAGTYRVRVGSNFDDRALRRLLDVLDRAGGARESSR